MKINRETVEENLIRFFYEDQSVATVYLFGSFGTPYFGPESDVDLGVLFFANEVPDARELFDLQDRISTHIGMEADVVLLNRASPIICMQVLRKGRKILERDQRVTNEFFVRTVNFYADLKRVRKPVEEQILNGRVYG